MKAHEQRIYPDRKTYQATWLDSDKKRKNYRGRYRLYVGLAGGLAGGLAVGLAGGLAGGLAFGLAFGLANGLEKDKGFGIFLQHIILRYMLRYHKHMPLDYAEFLDYCVRLRLLVRVGGGYKFMHALLQDHLAEWYEEELRLIESNTRFSHVMMVSVKFGSLLRSSVPRPALS